MPLPLLYTPKTILDIFPITGWESLHFLSRSLALTHELTRAAYVFAIAWLAAPRFPTCKSKPPLAPVARTLVLHMSE